MKRFVGAAVLLLVVVASMALGAAEPGASDGHAGIEASHGLEHRMVVLALQIGVILFAGYAGTRIARLLRIPAILGELLAGILIGPSVLGRLGFPGYSEGLFPYVPGALSVSPELYGFAVVASIVLLFLTGLQTDLRLFLRFAVRGSVVGIAGAAVSVGVGMLVGRLLYPDASLLDPRVVFLGVAAIATSVDITARILGDQNRMASPEGVTILTASVIEDVIGITLLAVVLGIDASTGTGPGWQTAVGIALRALLVWGGFTTAGILFSRQISRLLKRVRSSSQIAVLAVGLALILAGLFENAGLAMIIGAYVAGLSLANTDIAYLVQEKIETVHQFFDPIFFTVIGMLVDVSVFASADVIGYGLLFGILAIAAKFVGCGVPALALGFTRAGAARIGAGMVPRGEVALVIASIGLGSGLLTDRLFGVTIFMTLLTTLVGPPLLSALLRKETATTRQSIDDGATVVTEFPFDSREVTSFVLSDVLQAMRAEGFFVNASEGETRTYHIRKDSVFIAVTPSDTGLRFASRPDDVPLVNNLVYESTLNLQQQVGRVQSLLKPVELRRNAAGSGEASEATGRALVDWRRYLDPGSIDLDLKVRTKAAAIEALVSLVERSGRVTDRAAVLTAVLEREKTMSTGMQNGLAIPHGRTGGVSEMCVAAALVRDGIDFAALDGAPTTILFLIVSPLQGSGPHLQMLAGLASVLNNASARDEIAALPSPDALLDYLVERSQVKRR